MLNSAEDCLSAPAEDWEPLYALMCSEPSDAAGEQQRASVLWLVLVRGNPFEECDTRGDGLTVSPCRRGCDNMKEQYENVRQAYFYPKRVDQGREREKQTKKIFFLKITPFR